MSKAVKSSGRVVCEGCGRPLRPRQPVRWTRWADGVLSGPACLRCEKFPGRYLYDEDDQLVAYSFTAPLDGEYPYMVPLGADPGPC